MLQVGQWILHIFEGGNWWGFALAIMLVAIFRARSLFENIDWFRSRSLRELESALASKFLDGPSRKIIEDLARTEIFYKATGRRIDPIVREMIVRLHEVDRAKLPIDKLSAASKFIRIEDELPFIRITRSDKIGYAIDSLIGIGSILGVSMLPALLALVVLGRVDAEDLLAIAAWALMSFSGFLFALAQSRPYQVARGIAADIAAGAKVLGQQGVAESPRAEAVTSIRSRVAGPG